MKKYRLSENYIEQEKIKDDLLKIMSQISYEMRDIIFLNYYDNLDKPENVGRRYNISGELKADLNALKITINLIQQKNGILCNKISKSDFFIVYDDKNKEEILKGFKHPFDGKILTYQEFLSSLTE